MKTKILFCLFVTLSISAIAQSGADWAAYKRANGLNPSWTYNQWVAAGMPRGGGNNGSGYSGPSAAQIAAQRAAAAAQQAAAAKQQRQDQADALTSQGSDALNRQDYETAIKYFQDALEIIPDDSTIPDLIQKAKDAIAAKKQREQEAFNASKQEGLSQLKGLSQGGNFDSGTGLKGIGSTDSGLKGLDDNPSGLKTLPAVNTDPMVVDARNVPSGLPKSVDDAIASGYASAPTGVGDRVRKGFQAIQTHDWKVARAWFQDALNHDPDNAGLKHLVDLAEYTEKYREQKAASTSNVSNKPMTGEEIPADADPRTYALTSGKIHTLEAWKRFLDKKYPDIDPSKLPKDSDIEFLFPGLPAIQAREMNDYMVDSFVKATENDPQLKRTSQPNANQPQQPNPGQTIVN